jgi:cell division protein FtsN
MTMRKDYSTRQRAMTRRPKQTGKRWIVLVALIALLGAGLSVAVYQYKNHTLTTSVITTYANRFKTWIAEHRHHLQQGLVKVKQLATTKPEDQPIHFEFYTALPKMQVTVSAPDTTSAVPPPTLKTQPAKTLPLHAISDKIDNTVAVNKPTPVKPAPTKPIPIHAASTSAFNPDDLTKELAAQISSDTYVIQLGTYYNAAAADHYRQALQAAGMTTKVVKVTVAGKEEYRVQSGPWGKSQVKLVLRQLQSKGVTGVIRKNVVKTSYPQIKEG